MIKIKVSKEEIENCSVFGELNKVISEMGTVVEAFRNCLTESIGSLEEANKTIEEITRIVINDKREHKNKPQNTNEPFDLKEEIMGIKLFEIKDGKIEERILPKSDDGSATTMKEISEIIASLLAEGLKKEFNGE